MDSQNNTKKNKDYGFGLFKSLFEIKRPIKSATMPRTKNKSEEDDDDVSKNRLFVRNQSYRRSTKKNKYKKETSHKNPDEKFAVESESNVKRICQKFELAQDMNNNINNNIDENIMKVVANKEAQLALLREEHKDSHVNKRIYKENSKHTREKKIQSFVEAENDEEAEEYRRSLITEMDKELAQMKKDGFLDDFENTLEQDPQDEDFEKQLEDIPQDDVFSIKNDTFLEQMLRNRISNDSDINTIKYEENKHDNNKRSNKKEGIVGNIEVIKTVEEMSAFIDRFQDEFSESLSDELENGLHIVEAYNDEGRELIEVQVMIDRRTVNLDTSQSMIFYQNEDKSFDIIQDFTKVPPENTYKAKNETASNKEGFYDYMNHPQQPFYEFAPLSNRSTMYSTTSQEESSVNDDDDEGIEISRNKDREDVYQNVRRETFCDDKGIVRIERVVNSENTPLFHEDVSSPVSRSNSTTPSKRLEFIIDEIKSTERKYVEDLTKVVKVYKPYIEHNTPPDLKYYQGYLYGNIEKIYRRQKRFMNALENCRDVDEVLQCFIDNEILFEMYPSYFRNKPKADAIIKDFSLIIKEMQEKFEERLDFSAYLLTPVQRLGKYILFLENIEKQLGKLDLPVENAQAALDMVKLEMTKGNDSVAIESIENSPISKMDYGFFKMREKFNIHKPRKVEGSMVFLFTNVVVFTTTDPKNLETFNYYDSIKMNDLRIATFDDLSMHLTDFTKSKKKQNSSRYTYILESKSEKIWKNWKEAIEKILWDQLVKAKEKSLTMSSQNRRRYKVNRNRIKSAGSSVFYCE